VSGDTFSFVLRIWSEAVDEHGTITVWRGSIEQVGAGERAYFCDLDEVARYIQEQIGLNGHQAALDGSPAREGGRS
jgi:hypothetical protein